MMKSKMPFVCLFLVAAFLASVSAQAQSATPQETLNQYVADLQKNPDDTALREKIIALVQTMKPAPAIPEAAREHYVMAVTFMEKAKDSAGFERAVEQYRAASLAAPWWADAYKKLAIAQKAADHYDDAIASLNLYLLTQPADARNAQDEIYKLRALKQSAAEDELRTQRGEQQRQREAQQRDAPKILLRQLKAQYDGAAYTVVWCSHASQPRCFEEIGSFPCGCNDAEFHGSNWYTVGDSVCRMLFPEDGTIVISIGGRTDLLRGTPKGSTIADVVWEYREDNQWKPAWFQSWDGLNRFVFSMPTFDPAMARPVDNALYDPNRRYNYRMLKKE